jgi:integrase
MEIEVKPRGKVWAFSFYMPDGSRKRLSTGLDVHSTSKDVALAEAKRLARSMLEGSHAEERDTGKLTVTLGAALKAHYDDKWSKMKSWKELGYVVRQMMEEPIAYLPITEVSTKVLKDYVKTLEGRGLKPATINRKLTCISTVLRSREEDGEIPAVPTIPYLEELNERDRYVTPEEEEAALGYIRAQQVDTAIEDRPRWQVLEACYIVLVDTGVRLGEAVSLTEFNLRRNRDSIQFVDAIWLKHGSTKNGKGRVVPLTERASEALKVWLQRDALVERKVDQNWCIRMWAKVRAKFPGMKDVNLHILRHTCGSRLVEAGIGIFEVSKWLGHTDLKSTNRYVHLAKDHLTAGAKALNRRNLEQGQRPATPDAEEA